MTEGLLTKVTAGLKQFVASNPSVLTAKSLVNKKGGCIASKTQQSDSLCLAVNPPPFNKGGKFSARRGDSAENLIDGADGEQSPPSRLGIVSES